MGQSVLACLARPGRIFTPDANHKNKDLGQLPKDRAYAWAIKELPSVALLISAQMGTQL